MQPFDAVHDQALHDGADAGFHGAPGHATADARDLAGRRARVYALEDELLRGLAPRRQRARLIAEREGITASHVRKILADRV